MLAHLDAVHQNERRLVYYQFTRTSHTPHSSHVREFRELRPLLTNPITQIHRRLRAILSDVRQLIGTISDSTWKPDKNQALPPAALRANSARIVSQEA